MAEYAVHGTLRPDLLARSTIQISKPTIGDAEKRAVLEVLESGHLVQGRVTERLEREFAGYIGVKHAIAVSSGTAALHLALLAHGIGPGDEVITSPFTFIASVNSILYVGAKPAFADIDAETFNLDPDAVERAISPRTRAIMPVHLFGYPCDMDAFTALADRHNLIIIEDAAQAVGARKNGQCVGTFGTGAFSLYATKNITSAEGGMISTDDEGIADQVRLLRNHGMRERYRYEQLGFNFRMTDVHAAIGLAQMQELAAMTASRRANARYYTEHVRSVVVPRVKPGYEHVWHQYTIRVDGDRDRDVAMRQLGDAGVGCAVFYPTPAHHHAHVRAVAGEYCLPVAEQVAREVLSLPVHPLLSGEDLERVVAEVNRL